MSFLNRQLYKQKPQAWGPVSSVQASIFKNAEKNGFPVPVMAIPAWERAGGGTAKNYGLGSDGTLSNASFNSDGISFGASESRLIVPNTGINGSAGTIIFGYKPNNIIGKQYHILFDSYGGSNSRLCLYSVTGSSILYVSNAALYQESYQLFGFVNGATSHIAFAYGENRLFVNGKLNFNFTDGNPGTIGSSIYFGDRYEAADQSVNGVYSYIYWFNSVLSESQIAYLSDNPYALIQRVAPVYYSVPGGAITIKTVTDTGSGLDGIAQISNILSVSDSGSGFDVFAGLAAGISVVDVGSGTDAVQPAASVTVQDTGVAIELIQQISAACSVADTGTGADNIGRLLASLFVSDTGAGSDVITVLKELLKTVTDSGIGTDSVSQLLATISVGDTGSCTDTISQILADISVSDTGAGADFINLLKDILKTISDTGTGTDSVSIQPISVSVHDAGTALDLIGHIAVTLSVSDAGTVSEIISTIKTKLVTVTDTGTGSDSAPTISVSLTVSDVSAALDVVGQVLNSLTVSDTGSGLDRITKTDFNILPSGKVTVTFTIKTPGASFAMRTPKVTFNIE